MRLAKALLIGSAMTAISGTIGLMSLSMMDTTVAVASSQAGARAGSNMWTPPEPAGRSLASVPYAAQPGTDAAAALLLRGLFN